uniref:Uncharacterized protein n=1 Tax=Arundo donax TaxID=35708 RepID=A0A0A9EGP0_ARUDO
MNFDILPDARIHSDSKCHVWWQHHCFLRRADNATEEAFNKLFLFDFVIQ